MAKKEEMVLDTEALQTVTEPAKVPVNYDTQDEAPVVKREIKLDEDDVVNCLRDQIITVQYIPQNNQYSGDHVLAGGMAETARLVLSVPRLRSGGYVNVLTKNEMKCLEQMLGLERGALNVYRKHDNFWSNTNPNGISSVRLTKYGTRLSLKDPIQYIQYKILLANSDIVCPDMQTLTDKPKATYRFVLVSANEVNNTALSKMNNKEACFIEYGQYKNNRDVLAEVYQLFTGKPITKNQHIEFLQSQMYDLIENNAKLFLSIIKDPLLPTRILIRKGVDQGFILKKGDYYYLRESGGVQTPLCEGGQEPTLTVAAQYLSNPKRQEIKLSLEVKTKD